MLSFENWPEECKSGKYSPWIPNGEARAKERVDDAWNENALKAYQELPNEARKQLVLERILRCWIARLVPVLRKYGETQTDPDFVYELAKHGRRLNDADQSEDNVFTALVLCEAMADEAGVNRKSSGDFFIKRYLQTVKLAAAYILREDLPHLEEINLDDVDKLPVWFNGFYVLLLRRVHEYRGEAAFSSWLRAPVREFLMKHHLKADRAVAGDGDQNKHIDEPDTVDLAMRNEAIAITRQALERLKKESELFYNVLYLKYYEEESFQSIGAKLKLGPTLGAAKKKAERVAEKAERRLSGIIDELGIARSSLR